MDQGSSNIPSRAFSTIFSDFGLPATQGYSLSTTSCIVPKSSSSRIWNQVEWFPQINWHALLILTGRAKQGSLLPLLPWLPVTFYVNSPPLPQPFLLNYLPPPGFLNPHLKNFHWLNLVTYGLCCILTQFLVVKRWQVNKQWSFTQERRVKSAKSGLHLGATGNLLLITPLYP